MLLPLFLSLNGIYLNSSSHSIYLELLEENMHRLKKLCAFVNNAEIQSYKKIISLGLA